MTCLAKSTGPSQSYSFSNVSTGEVGFRPSSAASSLGAGGEATGAGQAARAGDVCPPPLGPESATCGPFASALRPPAPASAGAAAPAGPPGSPVVQRPCRSRGSSGSYLTSAPSAFASPRRPFPAQFGRPRQHRGNPGVSEVSAIEGPRDDAEARLQPGAGISILNSVS